MATRDELIKDGVVTVHMPAGPQLVRLADLMATTAPPPPPPPPPAGDDWPDAVALNSGPLKDHINIGDVFEGGPGSFERSDFKVIADAGFGAVRLPAAFQNRMQGSKLDPAWLAMIKGHVVAAAEAGLHVMLDPLHHYGALSGNPNGERPRAVSIHRQLAEAFADVPGSACSIELVNEHNLDGEAASQLFAEAAAAVWAVSPKRVVYIGGPINSVTPEWRGKLLVPPGGQGRVILAVHHYDSGTDNGADTSFTHQGPKDQFGSGKWPVPWPGSDQQKATIRRRCGIADAWAKANGVPVSMNEWGCMLYATDEEKLKYVGFMRSLIAELGWSSGYWNLATKNFGAWERGKGWRKGMLKALGLT